MIKNAALLDALEKSLAGQEIPDFNRNLRIFESLYREARSLGVFPLRDPLDGIEVDIHLARVIHARKPA